MHNFFLYKIFHVCGTSYIPSITKSSTTLAQFRSRLNGVEFAACQCIFLIKIFNIRTGVSLRNILYFNSELILGNIVIVSSNGIVNSRAFLS